MSPVENLSLAPSSFPFVRAAAAAAAHAADDASFAPTQAHRREMISQFAVQLSPTRIAIV